MERKILFVMNNSSSQKSIVSKATTLGELKEEMDEANISYRDMAFFEGRTRTELKDDASILPTNIPVASKGTAPATTTNDLVFMLTTANKKIKSGAGERAALYARVKELGLQEECKAQFGRNFTQCSTSNLEKLIEGYTPTTVEATAPTMEEAPVVEETKAVAPQAPFVDVKARNILGRVLRLLSEEDVLIDCTRFENLLEELNSGGEGYTQKQNNNSIKEEGTLSDSELDAMFDFV